MPIDREQLRVTYDSVADGYHQPRPEYPTALYTDLIELAGLRPGLTGCWRSAARPAKLRSHWPTAGSRSPVSNSAPELAARARRNLASYPQVNVFQGAFEDWQPPAAGQFSLVFAATAWHWIDPGGAIPEGLDCPSPRRSPGLLGRPAHVVPPDGDPIFEELQPIYYRDRQRRAGGLPTGSGSISFLITSPRSPAAACSLTYRSADSAGRSSTPPMSTSRCSTRSPTTSRWVRLSATGCMARSGGGSPSAQTAGSAGIGVSYCTSPAGANNARRGPCGAANSIGPHDP